MPTSILGLVLALVALAAPDAILFRGADSPRPGRVVRSDREAVVVRMARAEIESAERTADRTWPDRVTVKGTKGPISAAVLEEDAETLTIRFPLSAIARIERETATREKGGEPGEENAEDPDRGAIAGRVVRGGKPLAECRVRAVRLVEEKDFLGLSSRLVPVKNEEPLEATTNAEGGFRIDGAAPALFKLYFCAPGDTHWIRRLREEPDADVKAGFVTRLKDIDLSRRPL